MWTWPNMENISWKDQRICVRHNKREHKAFKHWIRKKKMVDWTHLGEESLVKEVNEGKSGKGRPSI